MEELRVSITADASGVGPGIAEATAQVTASADTIAAAQAKATAATKALAEAQVQLGAAAEAGNAQAATIIQEYAAASQEATAAVDGLTAATAENTTATVANAVAQDVDTKATYNRMQAMGVARVEMGAMTGSMGGMEMGLARLAAGSSALGPIIAGMMPVAIITAGVFIVGDLIKNIVEFSEKAADLAAETGGTWLDGAIGQMDGLAAATKQAEAEVETLSKELDALNKSGQQADFEHIRLTEGVAAAYRAEAAAKRAQVGDETHGNVAQLNNLLRDQAQLQKDAANAHLTAQAPDLATGGPLAVVAAAMSAQSLKAAEQLKVVEGQIATYRQQDKDLLKEATNLELQAAQVKDKHEKIGHAAKDPNADAKRLMVEEAIADARMREESAAKITAAVDETARKGFEQEDKWRKEAADRDRDAAEAYKTEQREKQQAAHESAQATITAANLDYQTTVQEIKAQEALGEISHRVAVQRLNDAITQRGSTIGGALGTEQGLFDPKLGAKEALEYKKLQDQMDAEARRGSLQRREIARQEATELERTYKRVADTFNQDFTSAFNAWATKSQTAGQAFGHMLGEMELQVVDFAAKWILEKAEMWAIDKLLEASGLAAHKAVQSAANLATITGDAGVAAAGAMAYYSAIDPPVAPAMAAEAFAETMSYAASGAVMDTGGVMGHMTYALNTSGSPERVLSPSQTRNFETMVNQGGARSAHLNYSPTIHGNVNEEMLQQHSAQMMSKLRGMIRTEAWQ